MPRWLLLLLLTLALQLPGTAILPLMDRDEPRFARATVEMMERGTWLVPYFNDGYRFDKPPLTYWWMRLHYLAGGAGELTARLHSVLAAWLTACVILSLGRRLFDERAGLLAAIIWLTCLQVLVHGRLCVADMPMILCVTLAMRAVVELLAVPRAGSFEKKVEETRGSWFWILYGALSAGFLAKGPIALLVPALALALFRWWGRAPLPWRRLRPVSGLLVCLLVVAAWGVPALIETEGLFWKVGMGEHVVKRGAEVLNGRAFIPGYYFVSFFLSFFPWSGFAVGIWRQTRAHWSPALALLAAWFAAPLLIFSFYATQLPHYTLPGFPAAALLAAHGLTRLDFKAPKPAWLRLALPVLLLALGGGLCALTLTGTGGEVRPLLRDTAWLLLALGTGGWVVGKGLAFKQPRLALLFGTALLAWPVQGVCRTLRERSATLNALAAVQPVLDESSACLGWDYTEPSLVFYSGRAWTFTGKADKVAAFLRQHPDALVLALRREWTLDHWLKTALRAGISSSQPSRDRSSLIDAMAAGCHGLRRERIQGFNAARMSWVEVEVWRQIP